MIFKICLLWALCTIGVCQSGTYTMQQQPSPILLDPEVRFGKLDNGFTYYIKKNEDPKNTVELRLVVKAGRIHEDEDQLEYAHLLEHLLAGKTQNFPNVTDHFSKVGGYSNAHTGFRVTFYEARLPSQDKQVVKDGIHLLRDWAQGLQWDEDYISTQRGAVEGEMRGSDSYERWIIKSTERVLLKNTGYRIERDDKRLENLRNFNPEAFKHFYKDWYRPDLQAAIIVGDINVDSIEYEIKRKFSDLKTADRPKSAMERLDSNKIPLDGYNQFTTVIDSVREELHLRVIRLRPNFENKPQTRDDYQKMLIQHLYTKILDIRSKHQKQQYDSPFNHFTTGYGVNLLPDKQVAANLMTVEFSSSELPQLKKKFQESLAAWKQMHLAIQQEDLERAKTALIKNYTDGNLVRSNSLIRKYADHFLYGKAAPNPEMEAKLIIEILSEIELSDLTEFIFEYGNLDKDTIFIFFKGTTVHIPDHDVLKEWLKEIDSIRIKPLKEIQAIKTLENVVDMPLRESRKIISITENEIGVSTIELSNGIKVVLKPSTPVTSTFQNSISLQAFRANTIPVDDRMEYLVAQVAPQVLQYIGAGPYNKFELDQFKIDQGITLNFRITRDNQIIKANSKFEDLPELFNLLHLYLYNPRKDVKGIEAWKMDYEKHLEGKGMRGSAEFVMEKIEESWYPQVPVLGNDELHNITLEQVFDALKKWFSSIENFTFIVTGDFKKEELIPVLVNTLSAFPSKNETSSVTNYYFEFPLKQMEEKLEFKNIDQVYVRLFFPIKAPKDLKTQIILNLISKALNEHIYTRLRIGSYSPRASGEWLDIRNNIFAFRIDFDSAFGKEEEMVGYALKEFRKLRRNGIEKEWLDTMIIHEIRSFESRFGSFGHFNFWPDYLQLKMEEEEDPVPGILNYGTLLEHFISQEDINAVIKQYMSEEHFQLFIGLPEGFCKLK